MLNNSIQDLYKKSGMSGRVGFGKRPAILVVDFVQGFTSKAGSPFGSDYMDSHLAHTRELLDAARVKDLPVVFSTEAFSDNMKDAAIWYSKMPGLKHLKMNAPSMEVDHRLGYDPKREVLLLKKTASPFFGTNLVSIFVSQRVDTVIVTGCTTSGCVRAAVSDSCAFGFRTIIVPECVADRAEGPHNANMLDMGGKYGDIVGLSDVLRYIGSLS
ncbi:isochorismatase family protein [Candidatus Formimonas warabiya]|uniref:Isochorismatase-like domain-containing protein n=1 Tax=Formimonas warabiya TaxID=1761012 RepID=A0A3G1KWD9_FORW1|nr:isochorismatase family protein [Candidatus Formimonas warabiya]ATW26751.1 hypothetical protein DCMF_20060 [Candidatus Formimonas warabiya]